jgi:aspartyl-tRNA(Asn)/glutamyl-tRNA(Gln) amidotransferase subunit A
MPEKNVEKAVKSNKISLSAYEMAGYIRSGDASPVDFVQQSLSSIETHNRAINAFSEIYADESLELAKTREDEALRGQIRSPLHGIPIAIKDLFQTRGRRTSRGSRVFADAVGYEDAPVVQRLHDAGAICVGKTTTTEFGWSAASTSPLFGPTRNPWNTELTSGGSSSGSGAAVAARMVPIALGSDGGGSVRIPAAFCGIFAMKATLGRVPVYPWSATETLSHAGPMTHNVIDSALAFDILKGPDWRDHGCLPHESQQYTDVINVSLAGKRIAYAPTLFNVRVDNQVARAVAAIAGLIEAELGVTVEEFIPNWSDPLNTFETIWTAGRGTAYGELVKDHLDQLDPGFANLIRSAQSISLKEYIAAMRDRATFSQGVQQFFENWDYLILPTVPILPFGAEQTGPSIIGDEGLVPWARWTPFSYPFNLTGNPAASIPCGWSREGLPIGLQIIGPRFKDAEVLSLCSAIERLQPWDTKLLATEPLKEEVD